jgi:hypothetical protein
VIDKSVDVPSLMYRQVVSGFDESLEIESDEISEVGLGGAMGWIETINLQSNHDEF